MGKGLREDSCRAPAGSPEKEPKKTKKRSGHDIRRMVRRPPFSWLVVLWLMTFTVLNFFGFEECPCGEILVSFPV